MNANTVTPTLCDANGATCPMDGDCSAVGLIPSAAGKHGARSAVGAEIVDAVDGKEIGKAGAGAIDAALDGADRAAADRRGVVIREAGSADQDQRLALVGRQFRQRGAEFLELTPAGLLGMRYQGVSIAAVGVFHLAPPLAVFGAEQVAQNGEQQ